MVEKAAFVVAILQDYVQVLEDDLLNSQLVSQIYVGW